MAALCVLHFERPLIDLQCLYQRAGKLSDAFADLNKALSIKKDYPEAAFRRAQILRKKGQFDLAIFDLVRTLPLLLLSLRWTCGV